MSLTSEEITAKNFKLFYENLMPFLGSYDKGKLTFVGEVKAFFAETAPNGFLICDGATYDKADYPQLANLLLSLTDHSAYEVSGDDTKFKVPDLRGEFLRGTGANGHANQGSGANVGVHQDATESPIIDIPNDGDLTVRVDSNVTNEDYIKVKTKTSNCGVDIVGSKYTPGGGDTVNYEYTSRPTNTSVLYCIAYKDTMVDLDFLSYGGERFAKSDMYDTNERVIGKWIDGKPLYQKTISGTTNSSNGSFVSDIITNIETAISIHGCLVDNGGAVISLPDMSTELFTYDSKVHLNVISGKSPYYNRPVAITLIYTKTTDTADSFKYSTPTDYSTEEKIVGTWIDGKPLWQKSFDITNNIKTLTAFGSYTNILNISSLNIEEVISCVGSIKFSRWRNIPYNCASDSSNYDISYAVSLDGSYLNAYFAQTYSKTDLSTIQKAYATIQYTKTTDA